MARKSLLKLTFVLFFIALSILLSRSPLSPVEAKERDIENRFSIEIESASVPFLEKLTGQPCLDDREKLHALEALASILDAYPQALSRVANIKHVYICSELTSFVTPVAGVTVNHGDYADIYMNAAFLDSIGYLTRMLHHELFHAIEFAHPFDNGIWRSLNAYEPYLEDITPKGQVIYYDPLGAPAFEPGFVSDYARVRPREDRAELFAYVMQEKNLPHTSAYAGETAMLRGDFILHKKMDSLIAYLDALFKGTNSNFQQKAAALKQPLFYAQSLYLPKDGAALRTGPSKSYPIIPAKGILLYVGKSRAEKGGRLLILLDENGQRVYAREKEVTPLKSFDYETALAKTGKRVKSAPAPAGDVQFAVVPAINGKIDGSNFINGGTLAVAACLRLNTALEQAPATAFTSFAPVRNLTYREEPLPFLLLGDTLYVDVEKCTGTQLRNALYAKKQAT